MSRFTRLELTATSATSRVTPVLPPRLRDHRVHLEQARVHSQRARFEAALRSYSRALRIDPNLHAAWLGQAQMLIELREHREADLWAARALELFPDDGDLLATRAIALLRDDQTEAASEASDAACRRGAGNHHPWLARGELLLATGCCAHRELFLRAVAGRPRDWFTRLQIGRVYLRFHRPADAERFVRESCRLAIDEPFPFHVVGELHAQCGRHGAARRAWQTAIELDPEFEPAARALVELRWTRRATLPLRAATRRVRCWIAS